MQEYYPRNNNFAMITVTKYVFTNFCIIQNKLSLILSLHLKYNYPVHLLSVNLPGIPNIYIHNIFKTLIYLCDKTYIYSVHSCYRNKLPVRQPAGNTIVSRLHMRRNIRLQCNQQLPRRSLRAFQDNVALLGGCWKANC